MKHSYHNPTPINHNLHCQSLASRLLQYNNQLHLTLCSSVTTEEEDNDSYISTDVYKNNNIKQQQNNKS